MRIITLSTKKTVSLFSFLAFFISLSSSFAQCPTVTNSTQSFCDIQSPTVGNLVALNIGGGVRWYADATGGSALSVFSGLTNNEDYFADDNSGSCGLRQKVVVTIFSAPVGQPFQGVCVDMASDAKIGSLIAVGNNVKWYEFSAGGPVLPVSTILMDNKIYYASQTNSNTGCETSRLSVFVNVGVVPVPTGNPIQEFCNIPGSPPTVGDLVATGNKIWYPTSSSASPLSLSTVLVDGQSYFATSTDPPCESLTRFEVKATLAKLNDAGTNGAKRICVSDVPTTAPFDLYNQLGGTPDKTGVWTGPLSTVNGYQGTVNVSTLTLAGSPYVFTYTVSSAKCSTVTSTVTIAILPLPTATISTTTSNVCSASTGTVNFTGTPNATVTYNLNGGSNQTIVLNASGNASLTTPILVANSTYNLVSVASSGTPSCSNTLSGSVTMTILPLPTANISTTTSPICSGTVGNVTFTGTPNATVTYKINGGTNQTILLNASGTASLTTPILSANSTYTLVSVASSGTPSCSRVLSSSITITVLALPTASISTTTSNVCSGTTGTVNFTGTPNATVTYNINEDTDETIVLNASGNASLTTPILLAKNSTYTLVSVSSSGTPSCSSVLSSSVTIAPLQLPTASVSTTTSNVCSGSTGTVSFTGTPNATVTYNINGGANQTILLNASGSASLTTSILIVNTTYNLVSVASSGVPSCTNSASGNVVMTVLPLPTAVVSTTTSNICPGSTGTVTFTGTPNATVTYNLNGGSNQTIVLNASGNASLTTPILVANSTYNLVSVVSSDTPSCSKSVSSNITITVLPLPTASISTTTSNVCSASTGTVNFTGTPNATVTYNLNGGLNQTIVLNASGNASLTTPILVANSTYNLVSVASSGAPSCSKVITGSITMTILQLPTVSISSTTSTICSGSTGIINFTGTPNATVMYNINGGSSQTIVLNASGNASLVTPVLLANSTYNLVSVTSSGSPSCSKSVSTSIAITVLPLPTASISTTTPNICSGSTGAVTFTGTPNATVTYNVNGGANQTIVLNASGSASLTTSILSSNSTYTLVSVASNGTPNCSSPLSTNITIAVLPKPIVSISSTTSNICSGSTGVITFTGTPNATVTYNINGGISQTIVLDATGNASLITPTLTTNSTYNLVSIASSGASGCSTVASGNVSITILALPTASISSTTSNICSGTTGTIDFTGTPNAIVTYNINEEANETIVLDAAGKASLTTPVLLAKNSTYTLVSVSSNGTPSCSALLSDSITISVIQLPTATISSTATDICSGQAGAVTITGTPNATVTYNINEEEPFLTVVLDATGSASLATPVLLAKNSTYTLVSVVSSGTPSCSVNLPDTNSITISVIQLPTATISSTATDICSGQAGAVTITGTPNATVTYNINEEEPFLTVVLDASGNASLATPVLLAKNSTYTLVSVVSSDSPNCSAPLSDFLTISVVQLPTVAISSATTNICSGSTGIVSFTGTPNATVTYTVDGGSNQTIVLDATGSTSLTTPILMTNSTYNLVSISTSDTPVCSQPQVGSITITIDPKPSVIISSDTTICSGENASVTFTGTPNSTVTYTLNGGADQTIVLDNSGSAVLNNTYSDTTIIALVSIITSGTPGCSQLQTGSVTVTVLPLPTATISSDSSVCSGANATITITGTPNATVTYNVNGGNNQSVLLDGAGIAIITSPIAAKTTFNLVNVVTSGTPSCSKPLQDSITISINPPPTVTISSSGTVCSGNNTTVTFTGTPNSIVTYTVNNGSNQFINIGSSGIATLSMALNSTSTFSLVSIALSAPPSCSQAQTGSTTISVTQPPIAGSNANKEFCSDEAPQDLFLLLGSLAQSGGTWSPALASGTGVFNPKVDPAGFYIYTVAGTPPCVNDTALVTVTIVQAANAGSNGVAKLCSNSDSIDLSTFLAGTPQTGGTWSPALLSGSGIFDPSIDLAGVYTYTVNGTSSCSKATATVTVSISPGPNAGISGSTTFCLDSPSKDLFDSLGGTPQVGGVWSPALTSGSGIFNPALDKAGIYTYTFAGNQPCDNDTATVTVTLNPSPDAGENATAAICSNVDSKDLFTYLAGTPQLGGTWTPTLASGTGFFDPKIDVAGDYTYTVGNPFCTPDSAVVTVNIVSGPDAGASGNVTFCINDSSKDLFLSLGGTPKIGGTWSPALASNTGVFNPAVDKADVYTYTLSGNQPCDNDTATVTVKVDPIANAGTFLGIQNVCTSVGTFDLASLLKDNLTGGIWTDNNNQTVINPIDVSKLTPNTYSFTYTVTNTCGSDNESVQFVIPTNPVLAATNIAVSSPNCKGNNVTVTLSNMIDGSYVINYNLSISNVLANQNATVTILNGTGTFTINAANIQNTGTTRVTFLNITNASTTCTTVINPNASADFILRPSSNLENKDLAIADVCKGVDANVSISGATSGLADGNYQFNYTINTVPVSTPTAGTTGTVTIVGGAGQFIIPASSIVNSGSYNLAITSITSLSSGCNNLSEDANASFQVFPIPDATGAILSAANTCLNFSNVVSISSANSLSDGIYTINYQLSGVSTATLTADVTFTNGNGSLIIPATELNNSGNVTVTILEIKSQVSSCATVGTNVPPVTFAVTQLETPILNEKGNEFCGSENPTIADLSENISGSELVVWYDTAIGGVAYNTTDLLQDGTSYFGSIKSASGCESAIRLVVTVDLDKCDDILIPDGFSPNTDGINDEFVIKNILNKYPNYKLEIYNRYGNILYKGNKNTPYWDGTTTQGGLKLGDTIVPVGVYFYILEYNDGITKPKQGRLYLSR